MSSANGNLDLLDVSTDDHDTLASKIETFYESDSIIKTQLAWHWERNQLMLDGRQWLMYYGDRSIGGMWQRASVTRNNEYIPRPVTNYLYSIYQTLKSYLIKEKPRSSVSPNTQSNKDRVASKIATLILESNWARLKEQYNYETAASILLTYGTVFKKSYWDTTTVSLVKVPRMQPVPINDPLTGQLIGMQEQPAVDPQTGDQLFDELPLGDLNTTVIDPYRISLDPLAMHLHEAKWIMETSIESLDTIRQMYSKQLPGYTGEALEIEAETELNNSLRRWMQLKNSSGTKGSAPVGSSGAPDIMVENSAVLKQYYERPSSKYMHGRLIVVAAGKVLYAGDSPYGNPEGIELGDWHPYSECRWELTPGRFWGKSPFDEGCELQKRINTIDSAIILTRKTTAMPKVLIPIGCGVEPGSITGRPGAQIPYRETGTPNTKPEFIHGVPVDASAFQERAQTIMDLKEITGATDILQGKNSPDVTAASAMNMLYEVATGKLAPILDRWKMFVEEDQKKQLKIIQKYYKEPRPEFIRMLLSRNEDLSEVEINNFIGRDLYDNCNVVVEAGSNIPKLQAANQAMKMELAQMGALNLQNPTNLSQFQQDMGIRGYDADVGPDQRRARWENDLLDEMLNSPDNAKGVVVLDIDNDAVHIQEHSTSMKSPAFMSKPFQIQQAYIMHVQQHEMSQAKKQQAALIQQQAQMIAQGGSPQAAPKGQAPQQQSAGNSAGAHQIAQHKAPGNPKHTGGVGSEVKNVLFGADVLTPATLGAQKP